MLKSLASTPVGKGLPLGVECEKSVDKALKHLPAQAVPAGTGLSGRCRAPRLKCIVGAIYFGDAVINMTPNGVNILAQSFGNSFDFTPVILPQDVGAWVEDLADGDGRVDGVTEDLLDCIVVSARMDLLLDLVDQSFGMTNGRGRG